MWWIHETFNTTDRVQITWCFGHVSLCFGQQFIYGKENKHFFVIRRNSMPWPRNVYSLLLHRRKRNEGPHGIAQFHGWGGFLGVVFSFWLICSPCIRDSSINYLSVAFFCSARGCWHFFAGDGLLFLFHSHSLRRISCSRPHYMSLNRTKMCPSSFIRIAILQHLHNEEPLDFMFIYLTAFIFERPFLALPFHLSRSTT